MAMMCVKVYLHMFLLQINQINKIKHSESVSWKKKQKKKKKKHDLCVIPLKIRVWSVFRWTQRAKTQLRAITIGPILFKIVLNWAQCLNKKKVMSLGVKK